MATSAAAAWNIQDQRNIQDQQHHEQRHALGRAQAGHSHSLSHHSHSHSHSHSLGNNGSGAVSFDARNTGAGSATAAVTTVSQTVTSSSSDSVKHHRQQRQPSLASWDKSAAPSTPKRDTLTQKQHGRAPNSVATITTLNQSRFSVRRKPLSLSSPVVVVARAGTLQSTSQGTLQGSQPFPVSELSPAGPDEKDHHGSRSKHGSTLELGPLLAEFPTPYV